MKALNLNPWNLSPQQARKLQEDLGLRVERQDRWEGIRFVAGADIAFDAKAGVGFAGVVVYRFPELVEVERQHASASLTFPYIPGLLAFREIPVLLEAFHKVKIELDPIFCDGHGISHPRRFGIACHLGLVLDRPTVGVAKSRLVGHYEEPAGGSGACPAYAAWHDTRICFSGTSNQSSVRLKDDPGNLRRIPNPKTHARSGCFRSPCQSRQMRRATGTPEYPPIMNRSS